MSIEIHFELTSYQETKTTKEYSSVNNIICYLCDTIASSLAFSSHIINKIDHNLCTI